MEIIVAERSSKHIPFTCGLTLIYKGKDYVLDVFGMEQLQKNGIKTTGLKKKIIYGESVLTNGEYKSNESCMSAFAKEKGFKFVPRAEVAKFIEELKQEGKKMRRVYVVGSSNGVVDVIDAVTNKLSKVQMASVVDAVAKKEVEIVNVGIERDAKGFKFVGKTGTASKINKGERVAVCTAAFEDASGKKLGYRFIDCNGTVLDVNMQSVVAFMKKFGDMVQNATLVDDRYIRGIKWEIPVITESKQDMKMKPNVSIGLELSFQPVVYVDGDTDNLESEVVLVEATLKVLKDGKVSAFDKTTDEKLLKIAGATGFDGKVVHVKDGAAVIGTKFCTGPNGNEGLVGLVTRCVRAGAKIIPVREVRSTEWPVFSLDEHEELSSNFIDVKNSMEVAVKRVQKKAVEQANKAIKEGQLYAIGREVVTGTESIRYDDLSNVLKDF